MRPYLVLLKIYGKTAIQYRAATIAAISGHIFWGLIGVMVLEAFFQEGNAGALLSVNQAVTFVWLGQAFWSVLPLRFDRELELEIRSGAIAYGLVRPLSLYAMIFTRSLALRFMPLILRCLPVYVVGGLFFGLNAPISLEACVLYIVASILGIFLSAALTAVASMTLFWTISGEGIKRLLPHMASLLSGNLVPLPLFPPWAQQFIDVQPFRCIIDIPARLYTGIIPVADAGYYLVFQVFWIFAFIGLGHMLIRKALRQLVIQGG